jgi:hypothetical protein
MESSQEESFNTFDLGISWDEFGDLDRPDLDAILDATDFNAVQEGKVVSLWKRHPNRQTGKTYLILIIVPHSIFCIIYLYICQYIVNIWFYGIHTIPIYFLILQSNLLR